MCNPSNRIKIGNIKDIINSSINIISIHSETGIGKTLNIVAIVAIVAIVVMYALIGKSPLTLQSSDTLNLIPSRPTSLEAVTVKMALTKTVLPENDVPYVVESFDYHTLKSFLDSWEVVGNNGLCQPEIFDNGFLRLSSDLPTPGDYCSVQRWFETVQDWSRYHKIMVNYQFRDEYSVGCQFAVGIYEKAMTNGLNDEFWTNVRLLTVTQDNWATISIPLKISSEATDAGWPIDEAPESPGFVVPFWWKNSSEQNRGDDLLDLTQIHGLFFHAYVPRERIATSGIGKCSVDIDTVRLVR